MLNLETVEKLIAEAERELEREATLYCEYVRGDVIDRADLMEMEERINGLIGIIGSFNLNGQ